ncbi:hypothetical protein LAUMK191_04096 [Mycobacterium attenuatum]|uniref:hypothetical protein n=1 Tax=Mycobacterium attenuatum TaxID=2341086 RepID=UPI000F02B898|nr:hypothetical protein [Mycobacterium attenuatum]VBA57602.1 hypothetical protein LAUMK191_04096 [Mycobacterium attenuatum]
MSTSVDNFDWLDAIEAHTETTSIDVLAAHHIIGTPTDITPDQLDASTFRLHLLGFLRPVDISDDGRTYTYVCRIPGGVAA